MRRLYYTAALSAALCTLAPAVTVLTSATFESPSYALGNIAGQQGWSTDLRAGTAAVSSTRGYGGSAQSLNLTTPANDESWAWPTYSFDPATSSDRVLVSEVMIYADPSTASGQMGLDLYGGSTHISGAAIATDTGNLSILGIGPGGVVGFYSFSNGPHFNFGAWNKLALVIDYSSPEPTFIAYLNGSGISSDQLTLLSDDAVTDSDLFEYGGNPGTPAVNAYFDNYQVYTVRAVPEPATLGALSLGLLALVRRRRRG